MPRAVTLIRSASLSPVAEYAYAATAPVEARLIFLAGACPLNEDGSTAAVGDYAGQAAKALKNMLVALADSGAAPHDVISTRVLVASDRREDLVAAWQVVRDAFGDHDVPSTLMGVTVLGYADQPVEGEGIQDQKAQPARRGRGGRSPPHRGSGGRPPGGIAGRGEGA
ncbi:RidA family protein [Actinomadura sp. DSM 109109]|nr:RidA family protein [Actinomadura lepetitiana]